MTISLVPEFPPYTGRFMDDGPGLIGAGSCTLCRSHKRQGEPGVVELGPAARPYKEGMVVLCFACAVEVGNVVGMLPPLVVERLSLEIQTLRALVAGMEAELEAVNTTRELLTKLTEAQRAVEEAQAVLEELEQEPIDVT